MAITDEHRVIQDDKENIKDLYKTYVTFQVIIIKCYKRHKKSYLSLKKRTRNLQHYMVP